MFIAQNKVRMHDIDMAGILYFPRQFRFAHDAFEDMLETMNLNFDQLFRTLPFIFVIVHAEADYFLPLHVGDHLRVELHIAKIGTTSFATQYKIFRGNELTGTAQTTHVCLDVASRKKIDIPKEFREFLEKYAH